MLASKNAPVPISLRIPVAKHLTPVHPRNACSSTRLTPIPENSSKSAHPLKALLRIVTTEPGKMIPLMVKSFLNAPASTAITLLPLYVAGTIII